MSFYHGCRRDNLSQIRDPDRCHIELASTRSHHPNKLSRIPQNDSRTKCATTTKIQKGSRPFWETEYHCVSLFIGCRWDNLSQTRNLDRCHIELFQAIKPTTRTSLRYIHKMTANIRSFSIMDSPRDPSYCAAHVLVVHNVTQESNGL